MNDIKSMVAKNIAALRQAKGMTQLELAEKLNYSDKAVSKWEHADSMPDISVLVEIADLFGVSLDDLVRAEKPKEVKITEKTAPRYRRSVICTLSVLLTWTIAVLAFVVTTLLMKDAQYQWLSFIYAVPASLIVWLVFNSMWFNSRWNYLIISALTWTILLSMHLTVLSFGENIWLIYLLGIPVQLMILFWSVIRRPKQK